MIGTDIPVYLDLEAACEGHIVILGMTKMGKTTLAAKLADVLGTQRGVVILDQTGEYSARRGMPTHVVGSWSTGCSVHEPGLGDIGPDFARKFVEATAQLAAAEYQAGVTTPRSIMMEERTSFFQSRPGSALEHQGEIAPISLALTSCSFGSTASQ